MALTIDINANARQAQREVKDLSGALDDTAGALDDLAREGAGAGDKIENTFRDMVSDAGKAERAVGDVRDGFKKAERGADDLGDGSRRGFGKIKDGAQEVTREVGSNLGEAVSSIRGDLTDLGQVGQDTLGGLAATLTGAGPAGIIGASGLAAGAVGLGLVTAELQRQQEEAEELQRRLSGMYSEAAKAGRDYLDTAQFVAEANSIMFDPDRADEWKRLQEDAKTLGVDRDTLIKANAGDLDSIAAVQQRINDLVDEEQGKREDLGEFWGGQNKGLAETAFNDELSRWQAIADEATEYQTRAQEASRVTSDLWAQTIRDAGTATEEVDEFGNRLYTLPDGKKVLVSAETGQATDDVAAFKGDVDGIADPVVTARFTADTSDVDYQVHRLQGTTIKIGARVIAGEMEWQ